VPTDDAACKDVDHERHERPSHARRRRR
jgi:hypothetical protein